MGEMMLSHQPADAFRPSDDGGRCKSDEETVLHDPRNRGKGETQGFWIANKAKRCIDDSVATIGNEG